MSKPAIHKGWVNMEPKHAILAMTKCGPRSKRTAFFWKDVTCGNCLQKRTPDGRRNDG